MRSILITRHINKFLYLLDDHQWKCNIVIIRGFEEERYKCYNMKFMNTNITNNLSGRSCMAN